jgi:membrane protein YdbS with pleckstrin-like domain
MLGLISCAAISALVVTLLFFSVSTVIMGSQFVLALYLIPLGFAIESLRRYHDDLYIFERERIIHKGGRLSLQYSVPSIRYIDIRAITVNQSIYGRIFDYGSIELNTAAEDTSELVLAGVRSPITLARVIEDIRLELNKNEPARDPFRSNE